MNPFTAILKATNSTFQSKLTSFEPWITAGVVLALFTCFFVVSFIYSRKRT